MNKQKSDTRKLLSTLVLAALGSPLGAVLAQETTVPGFNDLPLVTVAPRVRVVVDPELDTPAWVSFDAAGGFPTTAADPVERGREVFLHPLVIKMFGTLNPSDHLQFKSVRTDDAGDERIAYEQRERGVRVEGAYVTVTVSPSRRVREIHSRFLFHPEADWDRVVASTDVEAQARKAYESDPCWPTANCGLFGPVDVVTKTPPELVVLSSRLLQGTTLPPQTDRLAWRFDFPMAQIYVDASGKDGVLLVTSKRYDTMPHSIFDFGTSKWEISTDGSLPTSGSNPSFESLQAHAMIEDVDAFYTDLGRNGFDDMGSSMLVVVRWNQKNAYFMPIDAPSGGPVALPAGMLVIGQDFLGSDVIGHEITHGVTAATAGLIYAGESGALNESYSDVMGNLIFPDRINGAWMMGEDTRHGAVRDMGSPANPLYPTAHQQPDHMANLPYGCLTLDRCVHWWSGVPNLAAVLIAQGGQVPSSGAQVPGPGIGREKLAVLYYQTLVGGRLGESSNFLSQRLATVSECESLVASGYTARGSKPFTAQDCAIVEQAFDAVGISQKAQYGWTRFPTGLGRHDLYIPVLVGEHLYNRCTVAGQTLSLWSDEDRIKTTNSANRLTRLDMGGWGGWVATINAQAHPWEREVAVHLWADWAVPNMSFLYADTFNIPPGLTRNDCLSPATPGMPAPDLRTLYSTQRISHWASFFNGGKYDETVNKGIHLPPGCAVRKVRALLNERSQSASTPLSDLDLVTRGFSVSAGQPGDATALDALVHTWHDGLSAIAIRVAYDIAQDQGADCLVPGVLQENP